MELQNSSIKQVAGEENKEPWLYKTKMCKYFLAGHCPYVATGTCQFAHSRDELMAGRGSIHRAEYMNVGPAGTLPRAAFNWRDPTVLAAVGQLGGSFDDVGESHARYIVNLPALSLAHAHDLVAGLEAAVASSGFASDAAR